MQCALIAAAATYGGPVISVGVAKGCLFGSTIGDLANGRFAGAITGLACSYFSNVFATGVGIFAAGAAAETGPGAAAIGVDAYKALAAGLQIACGGLFSGGANALGQKLESNHEAHVAADIERNGRCLRLSSLFGFRGWSAVSC
jgi:hypothetical protein